MTERIEVVAMVHNQLGMSSGSMMFSVEGRIPGLIKGGNFVCTLHVRFALYFACITDMYQYVLCVRKYIWSTCSEDRGDPRKSMASMRGRRTCRPPHSTPWRYYMEAIVARMVWHKTYHCNGTCEISLFVHVLVVVGDNDLHFCPQVVHKDHQAVKSYSWLHLTTMELFQQSTFIAKLIFALPRSGLK